jgi:hypothetical protein
MVPKIGSNPQQATNHGYLECRFKRQIFVVHKTFLLYSIFIDITFLMKSKNKSKSDLLDLISEFNSKQINLAGKRYTPRIDSAAPNIEIESISNIFKSITLSGNCQAEVDDFIGKFNELLADCKNLYTTNRALENKIKAINKCQSTLLSELSSGVGVQLKTWIQSITFLIKEFQKPQRHLNDLLQEKNYKDDKLRKDLKKIDSLVSHLRSQAYYLESPTGQTLITPKLLISGEWGTGKTHSLCDATINCSENNQSVIFFLAKNFDSNKNVIEDLQKSISDKYSWEEICSFLNNHAQSLHNRSLIIIDGINEGNHQGWNRNLSRLLSSIEPYSSIGIVISCRTGFEKLIFKQNQLRQFVTSTHLGFEEHQFDAQIDFFKYYNIPAPEIPMLDLEFNRPLTLKIICESLRNLKDKKIKEWVAGISSGQKGMTHILEQYINEISENIEKKYKLHPGECWNLLKGKKSKGVASNNGIAPFLATNLIEYLTDAQLLNIIQNRYSTLSPKDHKNLILDLKISGILDEDVIWNHADGGKSTHKIIFRLPYQKFSDHLIARSLFDTYLKSPSSTKQVKDIFKNSQSLGKIFKVDLQTETYLHPGWAQALILEYPERVRKKLPVRYHELMQVLPKSSQNLNAYFEPFIEGLFWRHPDSYSKSSIEILNQYLNSGKDCWEKTIDALVGISIKPNHPLGAQKLYKYLNKFPTMSLDLFWSEFIRNQFRSPSIERLFAWIKKFNVECSSNDQATLLICLISLTLTTVVKNYRDSATKALVMLGEQYPEELFAHTLTTINFPDNYLFERMMAASYGVILSIDFDQNPSKLPILKNFAKNVYQQLFCKNLNNHSTHHILIRYYALGIIEIAQTHGQINPRKSLLDKPFQNIKAPNCFLNPNIQAASSELDGVIQMDFGNYTLGRLIPDRGNYDYNHPTYKLVRSQIEARILELGYKASAFKSIDREIAQSSFYARNSSPIDRYGKKYSWIAYHELYGYRDAQKLLSTDRLEERTPDISIDPTFPHGIIRWAPKFPNYFSNGIPPEDWMINKSPLNLQSTLYSNSIHEYKGEWIALETSHNIQDQKSGCEISIFVIGLLVNEDNLPNLKEEFSKLTRPYLDIRTNRGDCHYFFSGEIGKIKSYAADLLDSQNNYIPITSSVFEDNETNNAGINVEIPVSRFFWESQHSSLNESISYIIPSPHLIQELKLKTSERNINFKDKNSSFATLYTKDGSPLNDYSEGFFIRKDLLCEYLIKHNKKLVWCITGERNLIDRAQFEKLPQKLRDITSQNLNVHKQLLVFNNV